MVHFLRGGQNRQPPFQDSYYSYLVVGGGFDARIMIVKRSFWLVRHQFLAACSQDLLGVTPTKKLPTSWHPPRWWGGHDVAFFTQEHTRIVRICCRGDRIGDIELKGCTLDFGKSARLVCQPTQRHLCLLHKKFWLWTHQKKELLCFGPKASYFFLIAPPNTVTNLVELIRIDDK